MGFRIEVLGSRVWGVDGLGVSSVWASQTPEDLFSVLTSKVYGR